MSYHYSKTVQLSFPEAVKRATAELKKEGFGVLTEIDVRETLKQKLDVDFRPYQILGACNPPYAHQALQAEDKIGIMLPCNVVVQEHAPGQVEISAVNPSVTMQAVENPQLEGLAKEIGQKLQKVIAAI